jgi:hypothetical protein
MTLTEFDHGYWYAIELKAFAKEIGVPRVGRLRKNELERAIRVFLKTGRIADTFEGNAPSAGVKDVERGLSLKLRVRVYTNHPETKAFLEREALKIAPGMKRRSGARYRLNRWREQQIAAGVPLTYGELVREYVRLNLAAEPFAKIPHGRYINFVSEFMAGEKGATVRQAIKAWHALKKMDVPKDYRSWKKAGGKK